MTGKMHLCNYQLRMGGMLIPNHSFRDGTSTEELRISIAKYTTSLFLNTYGR